MSNTFPMQCALRTATKHIEFHIRALPDDTALLIMLVGQQGGFPNDIFCQSRWNSTAHAHYFMAGIVEKLLQYGYIMQPNHCEWSLQAAAEVRVYRQHIENQVIDTHFSPESI